MTSTPAKHPTEGLGPSSNVAGMLETVLFEHGIELAATIPGGPLMPLLEAIHRKRRIRAVLTRHESGAANLAEGYWRVARRPALVAVTAGPGVSNATTGIALAHAEHTPMIVISAQVPSSWNGRAAAQELDTVRLLEPITKCSIALSHPSRARASLAWLIRVATSGRGGPVHMSVPADLWARSVHDYPSVSLATDPCPRSTVRTSWDDDRQDGAIAALRERLARANQPCLLVGSGVLASGATGKLLALARRFPRLGIACTPRAKGAFPECHPQSLGVFGFAGHARAERALLETSDLVVVVGSRLGEIASMTWDERFNHVPLVQIDIEPSELGKNFPLELGIAADASFVLRQLLLGFTSQPQPSPRATATQFDVVPPAASGEFVHPARVMRTLNDMLQGDEHVFVDIGNTMAWALHYLRRDQPGRWHVNLMFGCMGHSLPAAIGGALAAKRPVVVLMGDAAFAMSGFELHTAVENGVPVVAVVLNDSGHGMVVKGSEHQYGPDKVPEARFERRIDADVMAASVGARSYRVTNQADLADALRSALTSRAPTLIDVHIDPSPLPPFGSRMKGLAENFANSQGGEG